MPTDDTLLREYVCTCGGRLVRRMFPDTGHAGICCGICSKRDGFIHEIEAQRRKADAVEVAAGLPAEVLAMLK